MLHVKEEWDKRIDFVLSITSFKLTRIITIIPIYQMQKQIGNRIAPDKEWVAIYNEILYPMKSILYVERNYHL